MCRFEKETGTQRTPTRYLFRYVNIRLVFHPAAAREICERMFRATVDGGSGVLRSSRRMGGWLQSSEKSDEPSHRGRTETRAPCWSKTGCANALVTLNAVCKYAADSQQRGESRAQPSLRARHHKKKRPTGKKHFRTVRVQEMQERNPDLPSQKGRHGTSPDRRSPNFRSLLLGTESHFLLLPSLLLPAYLVHEKSPTRNETVRQRLPQLA